MEMLSNPQLVPPDIHDRYEVVEWRNGLPVLKVANGSEWSEILKVLREFKLKRLYIKKQGGRKSPIAENLDGRFYGLGWVEKAFDTKIVVDGAVSETPTHSVDCFKNRVALEVEWNNKDPFFDRDLNNFRILFDLGVIDVGVIITRCDELQQIFKNLGEGKKYGSSTTHMAKLLPRIRGGGAGGCPIVVFGIRGACYVDE